MIRERKAAKFDEWWVEVQLAVIPEIIGFMELLNRDRNAVLAGRASNGTMGPPKDP